MRLSTGLQIDLAVLLLSRYCYSLTISNSVRLIPEEESITFNFDVTTFKEEKFYLKG